jgi:hypothetical protein
MCDVHVLSALKELLNGSIFRSDEEIKAEMVWWYQQQFREVMAEVIHRLVPQWDDCLNTHEDILSTHYSFTQISPWMCFIWRSLILTKDYYTCLS